MRASIPPDAEQATLPTPTTLIPQTLRATWDNLPTALLGGLLFSILWMPAFLLLALGYIVPAVFAGVLLVMPAWGALQRLHAKLLAGKAAGVIFMARQLPSVWKPAVKLGIVNLPPVYLLYRLVLLLEQPDVPTAVWVGIGLAGFASALTVAISLYALPLALLHGQSINLSLINGAILASRHAGNTVGLLALGILFTMLTYFWSLSLLFILPTLYGMFTMNHFRMALAQEPDGQPRIS